MKIDHLQVVQRMTVWAATSLLRVAIMQVISDRSRVACAWAVTFLFVIIQTHLGDSDDMTVAQPDFEGRAIFVDISED